MATYVPNANQLTEPVESREVVTSAAEHRAIKAKLEAVETLLEAVESAALQQVAGEYVAGGDFDVANNDIRNVALLDVGTLLIDGIALTASDFDPDSSSAAALRGDLLSPAGGNNVNMIGMTQAVSSSHTTAGVTDTFFAAHVSSGPAGGGYGFHALDSGDGAAGGGAVGGATERTALADGVVGNRRGTGPGNGVIGSRWESGDGSGVTGVMRSSGNGHGIYGFKVLANISGHAVHGRNESTTGSGVYGLRLNGAGDGYGVLGYASGAGANPDSCASVFGQKLAGDTGNAGFFDGRGTHSALKVLAAANTAPVAEIIQDATNTASSAVVVEKQNGTAGTGLSAAVTGGGARTGKVVAARSIVNPGVAATGTPAVTGHEVVVGAGVTGSTDVRGLDVVVTAPATSAIGVAAVASGAGTVNYGVYGNAAGAAVNWSGYFVGSVFVGNLLNIDGGGWNQGHLILGTYHLWIDAAGRLRVRNGAPSSDADGIIVGTQV